MERYWQPWRGCQPLLSVIISYFLYLDSWFIRADMAWTLLFRCWLKINIPAGNREKNRWMSHNNFQNHMTAQLPFSMTHSNHFLGHSNGTKILTKMLYLCQWHNARSIQDLTSLSTSTFNMNMMTQPRSWTPYIVWIRHLGMFWPNSLRGWVFNYAKNCPAHSALATADPWEHGAHCSRSLLGMSLV